MEQTRLEHACLWPHRWGARTPDLLTPTSYSFPNTSYLDKWRPCKFRNVTRTRLPLLSRVVLSQTLLAVNSAMGCRAELEASGQTMMRPLYWAVLRPVTHSHRDPAAGCSVEMKPRPPRAAGLGEPVGIPCCSTSLHPFTGPGGPSRPPWDHRHPQQPQRKSQGGTESFPWDCPKKCCLFPGNIFDSR